MLTAMIIGFLLDEISRTDLTDFVLGPFHVDTAFFFNNKYFYKKNIFKIINYNFINLLKIKLTNRASLFPIADYGIRSTPQRPANHVQDI